jgi:hypothetical protein
MKTSFGLRCGALAASALLLSDAIGGSIAAQDIAPMKTRDFEFASGNKVLSGFIDQPGDGQARALIVFIHGSGGTNIRKENRYFDLRRRFTELGIACVTWDKPAWGEVKARSTQANRRKTAPRKYWMPSPICAREEFRVRTKSEFGEPVAAAGARRSLCRRTLALSSGFQLVASRRRTTSQLAQSARTL